MRPLSELNAHTERMLTVAGLPGQRRMIRSPGSASSDRFLAQITGRLQIGGVRRWKYAWTEVRLQSDDTFATFAGARSGTTSMHYALNVIEANNRVDGTGTQGNSVKENRTSFPSGMDLQPVGGSDGVIVIVEMRTILDADRKVRYVFSYENAQDGTCS